MFNAIHGLPVHALVVHAAVGAIPLLTLLSILFVVPRTQSWSRWPLAVLGVGAPVIALVAKQSGQALQHALGLRGGSSPVAVLVLRHAQLANTLVVFVVVHGALAILTALTVGPGAPFAARVPARAARATGVALPALMLVAAVLTSVWVYRVGDIGARAVWNPTGTVNYSRSGN